MIAVPLTRGYEAFIDPEDMERVAEYKWHVMTKDGCTPYAATHNPDNHKQLIWLHRLVKNAPTGVKVDHKDGDGLNCCKDNLRYSTTGGNAQNRVKPSTNTSGYKGVDWHKFQGKWRVRIQVNGKSISLGYFKSLSKAAQAYRDAAIRYHGEFAKF